MRNIYNTFLRANYTVFCGVCVCMCVSTETGDHPDQSCTQSCFGSVFSNRSYRKCYNKFEALFHSGKSMLFLFLAVSVRVTSGFRTALPSYFIIKFLHFFSGLLSKSSVWQTNLFLFEILTLVLRPVLCGLLESTVKCAPTRG